MSFDGASRRRCTISLCFNSQYVFVSVSPDMFPLSCFHALYLPVFCLTSRFGEELDLLHDFGEPFTEEAGAKIVDGFTFDQQRTNTAHTLEGVVSLLEVRRKTIHTCVASSWYALHPSVCLSLWKQRSGAEEPLPGFAAARVLV